MNIVKVKRHDGYILDFVAEPRSVCDEPYWAIKVGFDLYRKADGGVRLFSSESAAQKEITRCKSLKNT